MEAMKHSRLLKGAFVLFILVVAVVIVSIFAERAADRKRPTEAEERARLLAADRAAGYAKPTEVRLVSGTVLAVSGATIQLDILDPADYLPHPDGSPRNRVVRFAVVTKNTKFMRIHERTGVTSPLKFSELAPGDLVTVRSEGNILSATEFEAAEVRLAAAE